MVQVRDNRKVCRLAVPPGVFTPPNRCLGKSPLFSNRVRTPGCTPRRAATLRASMAIRRPKVPPVLTLDHGQSRWITVDNTYFFRIGHQPFAGTDEANRGKSRLIPVNPASQIFSPFQNKPSAPFAPAYSTEPIPLSRNCPKGDHGDGQQLHLIPVNSAQNFSSVRGRLLRSGLPGYQ